MNTFTPTHEMCACGAGYMKMSPTQKRCPVCRNAKLVEKTKRDTEKRQGTRRAYYQATGKKRASEAQHVCRDNPCGRCPAFKAFGDCNGRTVCPDAVGKQMVMEAAR
jgi:hypothetical protein